MNYFFDENFAPPLARAISHLHLRDHDGDKIDSWVDRSFGGMKDQPWIEALTATGLTWAILTRDQMRNERQAVQGSNFNWFIFARGWATLPFWEQSWRMVKVWPDIVSESEKSNGVVFTIRLNGRIVRSIAR